MRQRTKKVPETPSTGVFLGFTTLETCGFPLIPQYVAHLLQPIYSFSYPFTLLCSILSLHPPPLLPCSLHSIHFSIFLSLFGLPKTIALSLPRTFLTVSSCFLTCCLRLFLPYSFFCSFPFVFSCLCLLNSPSITLEV